MTDPGAAPNNDFPYEDHAGEVIDQQDMEAHAANVEQEIDADQIIRHNMYIGWVMGVSQSNDFPLEHKGGNLFGLTIDALRGHTFVIPYPPKDWKP